MHVETYAGTHAQIGQQIGQRHAAWIHRTLAQFVDHHTSEMSQEELSQLACTWRHLVATRSPSYLPMLEAISESSGAPLAELLAMNFRIWNILAHRRQHLTPETACTNIAVRDPDLGVLLGGSLDDIRTPWYLARFLPRDGLAHLCVTWVGTAWAVRGINEAGLAIGSSSMYITGVPYAMDQRFDGLAMRHVLETCRTAQEAVDCLRSLGPHKGISVIVADRQGQVLLLESCWSGEAVRRWDRPSPLLFCVNHVQDESLRAKMIAQGYDDNPGPWSSRRLARLTAAAQRFGPTVTLDQLKSLLADHDHYPDSICSPTAAYHTIAAPQHQPLGLWVSDGPPCRKPFTFVPLDQS